MRNFRLALILGLGWGMAVPLGSAPLTWVSYNYRLFPPETTQSSGQLPQTSVSVPLTQQSSGDLLNQPLHYLASESVSGSISNGTLHAYASASLTTGWFSVPISAANSASISMLFGDRIYFESSTLAAGTPVQFGITLVLHSIVQHTGMSCLHGAPAYAQAGGMGILLSNTSCDAVPTEATQSGSVTLSSTVGGFRDITFELDVLASAIVDTDNVGNAVVSALADGSNTGSIFIQVLTPGASFRSESGATYTADEVPEPATLGLIGLGLLGLAFRRRTS